MNAYDFWFNIAQNELDTYDLRCRLRDMAMDYLEKKIDKADIKEMADYNEIGENKIWSDIEDGVSDYIDTLNFNEL